MLQQLTVSLLLLLSEILLFLGIDNLQPLSHTNINIKYFKSGSLGIIPQDKNLHTSLTYWHISCPSSDNSDTLFGADSGLIDPSLRITRTASLDL